MAHTAHTPAVTSSGAFMENLATRWRIGITLAVLWDIALVASRELNGIDAYGRPRVDPDFSVFCVPWAMLGVLWLIGWIFASISAKKNPASKNADGA